MKLRNKKTGEIANVIFYSPVGSYTLRMWEDTDYLDVTSNDKTLGVYNSLAELNEEWEDYNPAEPLIKDEKIRKAVRAWAELNNFNKVKLLVDSKYGSQFEGGYGFGRITFNGITLDLDYPKEYTIAELCGEEE